MLPLFHSTTGRATARSEGLIQHSTVRPLAVPTFKLDEAATLTNPVPLRLNAWPTSPATKLTPLERLPGLLSTMSLALPSAAHQLTNPAGGGTQFVETGLTVSNALELGADPKVL